MLWNNCAHLWTVLLSTFSFFERYFSIIKLLTLARTVFKERSRRIFSLHVSLSWPHTRQVLYTVQYIISFIFYNFKIDLEWIFIFFYTAGSREISLKRRPSRTMLPGPFGNKHVLYTIPTNARVESYFRHFMNSFKKIKNVCLWEPDWSRNWSRAEVTAPALTPWSARSVGPRSGLESPWLSDFLMFPMQYTYCIALL